MNNQFSQNDSYAMNSLIRGLQQEAENQSNPNAILCKQAANAINSLIKHLGEVSIENDKAREALSICEQYVKAQLISEIEQEGATNETTFQHHNTIKRAIGVK